MTVEDIPELPGLSSRDPRSSTTLSWERGTRETLEISVEGRDAAPVLFVEVGARIYVVPSTPPGRWFSAAVREGCVEVRRPPAPFVTAGVNLRSDRELLDELRGEFVRKYGSAVWARYFEGASAVLELEPRSLRPPTTPVAKIRGEFDATADVYDARIAQQPVEVYLKDRVADAAVRSLEGLDPILEIGPGTGYHTSRLAAAGHQVVAIDISGRMLERLRARSVREGWAGRLETHQGVASDLDAALADVPDGTFGGAFSAFGAFDVEPDLSRLVRTLARVVRSGGRFALTSLNRPGLGPVLWELALGRPYAAGARFASRIRAGRIRYPLALYPRSPFDWDRLLSTWFRRESVTGVSVLAPPFDATRALALFGSEGVSRLRQWDGWLTRRRSTWTAAEWLFLTYRRTDSGRVADHVRR